MTHNLFAGKSCRNGAIGLVLSTLILNSAVATAAPFTWKAVAVTNTPAPGLPDASATFIGLHPPQIDEAGRISFSTSLLNTPITGALYQTGPNAEGLSPVVYDGQPTPGIANAEFQIPRVEQAMAGGGRIAFWIDVNAANHGPHIASAIYSADPQNPQLIMRSGQTAPGVADGIFRDNGPWDQFRASGNHVAFLTSASVSFGTGIVDGIWRGAAGASPEMIVYSGMPTPVGAGSFDAINLRRVTESGTVGFRANTGAAGTSLWQGTPGNLHLVAGGLSLSDTDNALFTRAGTWFFYARNDAAAVRVKPDGSTTTLAVTGQQAPGLPAGVTFDQFGGFASGREGSAAAFWNSLSGPGVNSTNDWAAFLWSDNGSSPRLIAREGDAAPGTAPGVVFTGSPIVYANDFNQFVMYYDLAGSGVTNTNDSGLWCDTGDGQLQLLLREGDNFLVNGTPRMIREIDFNISSPGTQDDRFNNLGQYVVGLTFTDNSSGIFTVQVPEPSVATIAMIMSTSMFARRRLRR
jgi:hypothetical protein